ncbi:ABC-three component system protein [Clostridium sp.]|uniref:ABC-three component system protein n=1 Tax=Clostridium sp. TaxID=1506 RepID=UPI0032166219
MDRDEKYLIRIMFQNKIYSADAQGFENLFTKIMEYKHPDFRAVKPQGSFGDMKNDGYILNSGMFYQVYGPEDISKSIDTAINKLEEDFNGLLQKWSNEVEIKEFNYVVNDKYKGVHVTVHKKLLKLKNIVTELGKEHVLVTGLIVAKDLENRLFELDEDNMIAIVGLSPRTSAIYDVDYDSLNDVIEHIFNLPAKDYNDDELYVPEFDEKIRFNGLSKIISRRLEAAAINYGDVEVYFDNQGDFLREDIKNRFKDLYIESKKAIKDDEENFADRRYMYILQKSMPKESKQSVQQAVECLMAFYFESCDIFEMPEI